MALDPVPLREEIVRLYNAGALSAELARHHETPDGEADSFIQRCIALHNSGDIDLIAVPSQPAFTDITGHAFFTAQHLYCEAIPKLRTNVTALMKCCRILIEQAGADGFATQPNGAFRTWCQNNPARVAAVIRKARAGDELAKRFVTFALQASNDNKSAIDFVRSYTDDRRVSGMMALAGTTFANAEAAHKAIEVLEPLVADGGDDHVRINALLAAFDVMKKHNNIEMAKRLTAAATKEPGPQMLDGLAQVVWLHHALLDGEALSTALVALTAVNPENLGSVRILDMGLRSLLGTHNETLALNFLTEKLKDGKLTSANFGTTTHELTHGNPQRLYELIVRWFLSGCIELCSNVSELVGMDKERTFNTDVKPLGLTPAQQFFLCRKAIGFLFLKPVVCCSIIVSVLRAGDGDVVEPATELLFDPILLNYGRGVREYLMHIPLADPAYGPIQHALAKIEAYYLCLGITGTIKEFHPSDYQQDVVRQRIHDEMQTARKNAEGHSVLLNLVRRSTILYGKRSLTYVTDYDGTQRAIAMDLKSVSASFELPRREVLDPVGLDYMLRVYRVEKLK